MATIIYSVEMPFPANHVFTVKMEVKGIADEQLVVELPVWTPGSYLVREYAKNINAFKASDIAGNSLPFQKSSKNTWLIYSGGADVIIQYEIYAYEESVRTNWLDATHASIIPAAFFMWVKGYSGGAEIHITPHNTFKKIATALPNAAGNNWELFATSKDELYDSPIEIGNHSSTDFLAEGVIHTLAIYGEGNHDEKIIIADLIKIIQTEVAIFGQHPCKKYLFILLNSNTQRGGLEHLHSTSLIFKRFGYADHNSYLEFISLCAHEYFHLWNVKRLRPAALGPFNYGEENYTTGLWVAEGFTSYYDDLIVYRAAIYKQDEYLAIVEKNINEAENAPGKNIQSVAEASFDAWIKYYRQNENSNNSQVNYYVRGGVLALLLDIIIISNSNGENCLDDVMREAYNTFYVQQNRGFTEEELKSIIEKYAKTNLDDFYRDHVFGTTQINYQPYFEKLGLQLIDKNAGSLDKDFGLTINDKNIITAVRKGSSGELAGLNVNDEVIAINEFRYNPGLINILTNNSVEYDTFWFLVNHNGIIKTLVPSLAITDKVNYKFEALPNPTPTQQLCYKKWLHQHINP